MEANLQKGTALLDEKRNALLYASIAPVESPMDSLKTPILIHTLSLPTFRRCNKLRTVGFLRALGSSTLESVEIR